MADLGTMKQDLYRTLHLDSNTSGTLVAADVTKAIIEAIRFNKNQSFWSNVRQFSISTTQDQYRYSLPSDYVGLASDVLYKPQDNEQNIVLRERSVNWCEEQRYRGDIWDASISTGNPDFYGIDVHSHELVLIPVPYQDGDVVTFKYITDLGVPSFKYTSGAWTFYAPNSTVALTDSFSNAWFTDYYELTMNRAAFLLWTTVYGGSEEAQIKAQEHLKLWAEQLNKLRTDVTKRASKHQIRRYI